MQKQPSLRRNFLMNTILRAANVIFPLITILYVSRILLPAGLGRVSFATSFIAYFNMAAQLGIPTYGIRACAKVRDDKEELSRVTLELLLLNLIGTVISYAAITLCLLFIPRVRADKILFIILSLTIILNAIGMEWLYQGLEQYTYITIRSLIFKTVALAAVFLLVKEQKDVLIYAGISIFASSASNILNFLHAQKYVDLHSAIVRGRNGLSQETVGSVNRAAETVRGDGAGINLRRHLKPVIVLFAMVCAVTVFSGLDEVMLGFIRTDADVGIYHAAVRIKVALVDIITALSVVLLPRASYYVEHERTKDFLRITDKGMRFVLLTGAGLTVYFMLYAGETVLFLFGPEFESSILPMILIMPVVLLTGMTRVMGNQILIPGFGPSGAVIGTLAAELIIVLVQLPRVKEEVGGTVRGFLNWRIAVAIILSIAVSFWIKHLQIGLLWKLIVSCLLFFSVYIGSLLLLKDPLAEEAFHWVKGKIPGR